MPKSNQISTYRLYSLLYHPKCVGFQLFNRVDDENARVYFVQLYTCS